MTMVDVKEGVLVTGAVVVVTGAVGVVLVVSRKEIVMEHDSL